MKILALADTESRYLYNFYTPGKLDGYDLIIGCGDLHWEYLEFIVTLAHCPVLYVHGNHDEGYEEHPPGGCICIDDKIYVHNGIRIMGLGGSYRYRPGTFMFTERQMRMRILRLLPSIWRHRGFDILVTHAPALHVNDFDNITHRGFDSFNRLIEKYHPKYFLHGHIHRNYGMKIPRVTDLGETRVINAYDYYPFDYE